MIFGLILGFAAALILVVGTGLSLAYLVLGPFCTTT
jgi:hypothetical protein